MGIFILPVVNGPRQRTPVWHTKTVLFTCTGYQPAKACIVLS